MAQNSPAAPSATILLLRDGVQGLEVFMVVRNYQIDFASGALVFPGGKVDEGDRAPSIRPRCRGHEEHDEEALALRICAVREVFEECGVLLAEQGVLSGVPAALTNQETVRAAVHGGSMDMETLLSAHDLGLDLTALVPFAHWITPDMMPRRYDTHFFLARVPGAQAARHDGDESVDSVWINPARALQEAEDGKWTIIFPTRMNLMKLACSATVDEALARAAGETVVTVKPWVENTDEGAFLRIPDDAGYDVTREPLEKL
ncbi:MAG: NUDIX hydrolase [Alphaproteobacteria bacterium]